MQSETAPIEDADEDNPEARERWFRKGREPLPGHSAAELRHRAHQQKMQVCAMRAKQAAVQTPTRLAATSGWVPLGPAPLTSDAGTGQNYGLVSGRANAVAIDPADMSGNTVYVGGAFGGLWRSTNAANVDPSAVIWTPLTDDQPTLSFGAIAVQPNNATNNLSNVILVGTGEANAAIDSYYGLGFLRSGDAGRTWTLISTANSGALSLKGLAVARIAFSRANPSTVVAAVTGSPIGIDSGANGIAGIYTSTDAGLTWTRETPTDSGVPISANSATSVVFNAAAGLFYAAIRYHGIYLSPNGITWTRLASQPGSGLTTSACPTNGVSTCPMFRAELAVVPARNEMYAWYIDSDIADQGIWGTINGGNTWTSINENGLTNCGDSSGCGTTQAFFNMSLAAVPNGSLTDLYAGAVNEFKCPSLQVSSTTCGGATAGWLNLTHVYGCSPPGSIAQVHPDEHAIDFAVTNGAALTYFVNDGGVYRALDGFRGLTTGTCGGTNAFDDLNARIGSLTQFVFFAQHPTSLGTLLGGTQDNGSPATNQAITSSRWINVNAGDGGYNEINPANTSEWFTANTDVSIQRCTSGITCTALTFLPTVTNNSLGGDHGAFYTPYILDPLSAVSELLVGTCLVWRGPGSGANGFASLSFNFETGATGSCTGKETNLVRSIAAGGPVVGGFSDMIYATTEGFGSLQPTAPAGGRVFRTLHAEQGSDTWADVTQSINPDQYTISSVVIDPVDTTGQTAYVAIMGFGTAHVFKTTNAGASWADFSGTGINALPSVPANTLAIDSFAGMIYVGTDIGVFVSPTSAATWTEVAPAAMGYGYLPNVPVTKLRIFNSAGQKYLRASTYGRGIWQYNLVPVPDFVMGISNTPQTIFSGQQASFSGVLTALNGYSSSVTLSCTAGTTPPPSTCALVPASLTPIPKGNNFTLTTAAVIGDYTFNVHGLGADFNSVTHDQGVTLHVVDFALGEPSPPSISANRPNTSNSTSLPLTAQGSFSQAVDLSCTNGLPAGATCVFSPVSVSPTAGNPLTANLAIATSCEHPAGNLHRHGRCEHHPSQRGSDPDGHVHGHQQCGFLDRGDRRISEHVREPAGYDQRHLDCLQRVQPNGDHFLQRQSARDLHSDSIQPCTLISGHWLHRHCEQPHHWNIQLQYQCKRFPRPDALCAGIAHGDE